MILVKIITAILAISVISHSCILTLAQENPGSEARGDGETPGGPKRPGGRPEGSGGPSGGARPRLSPNPDSSGISEKNDDNIGQRLFFSTIVSTQSVSCDYSTQAGSSCLNCRQKLVCTRRGGFLKTCRGLLQHCTDGRCSFRQSDACAAAATTTVAAATTTEADTTTVEVTTTAG